MDKWKEFGLKFRTCVCRISWLRTALLSEWITVSTCGLEHVFAWCFIVVNVQLHTCVFCTAYFSSLKTDSLHSLNLFMWENEIVMHPLEINQCPSVAWEWDYKLEEDRLLFFCLLFHVIFGHCSLESVGCSTVIAFGKCYLNQCILYIPLQIRLFKLSITDYNFRSVWFWGKGGVHCLAEIPKRYNA